MKIVIAPDSFKECLDAASVAQAIAAGMRQVLADAQFELVPMADGGEGTVAALVAATGGRLLTTSVSDPLGYPVAASYGLLGGRRTAVVEMAQASGLARVPLDKRDPTATSSFGTGQLIRAALAHGPQTIIVGLGGSATNDGGAGMLQALGVRFLEHDGRELTAPMNGALLNRVARIDLAGLDERLRQVHFETACDVDNPLTGATGASAVFGPQKGATPTQVVELDAALGRFYRQVESLLQCSVSARPGAGAAGGLGAALLSFLSSTLRPGIDIVIEAVELESRVQAAALAVTGEGMLDGQTLRGKAPAGVARLAHACGVPVVALGGGIAPDEALLTSGLFDAVEAAVARPMSTAEALSEGRNNIRQAGVRIALWLKLAKRLPENRQAGQ